MGKAKNKSLSRSTHLAWNAVVATLALIPPSMGALGEVLILIIAPRAASTVVDADHKAVKGEESARRGSTPIASFKSELRSLKTLYSPFKQGKVNRFLCELRHDVAPMLSLASRYIGPHLLKVANIFPCSIAEQHRHLERKVPRQAVIPRCSFRSKINYCACPFIRRAFWTLRFRGLCGAELQG